MKKKTVGIMLSLGMAMSLMACGSSTQPAAVPADTAEPAATTQTAETTASSTEAATDTAASTADVTTIKDGTLMVGVEIGYPPMEYFDTDGATPIGFDVEVANALADYLGLELELVDTSWDGIFAGVDTGKYDCIISCVSITDERKEQFNLTKPYVSNHTVLIVPNDSEIDSMEALNGHSTAVQAETTADDYMKEHSAELGAELFHRACTPSDRTGHRVEGF